MKYLNKVLLLFLALLLSSPADVFAAGPGFGNDVDNWNTGRNRHDDDDNDDDDWCEEDDDHGNEIPLDGGLSFLAAAGAAYGVKRVRDSKKKK